MAEAKRTHAATPGGERFGCGDGASRRKASALGYAKPQSTEGDCLRARAMALVTGCEVSCAGNNLVYRSEWRCVVEIVANEVGLAVVGDDVHALVCGAPENGALDRDLVRQPLFVLEAMVMST